MVKPVIVKKKASDAGLGPVSRVSKPPKPIPKPKVGPTFIVSSMLVHMADQWRHQNMIECKYGNLTRILIEPHPVEGAYIIGSDAGAMFVGYDRNAVAPCRATINIPMLFLKDMVTNTGSRNRKIKFTHSRVELVQDGEILLHEDAQHPLSSWLAVGDACEWPVWQAALPELDEFKDVPRTLPQALNVEFFRKAAAMFNGWLDARSVCFATCGKKGKIDGVETQYRSYFMFFPCLPEAFVYCGPMGEGVDPYQFDPVWLDLSIKAVDSSGL